MDTARLFDLIEKCELYDLREKLEAKDECKFGEAVNEEREKLFANLNDEQKEQVRLLELAVENRIDEIHYQLEVYLTSYAFRLGMEMQRAFDKDDFSR
ncbi:MAG: hypothetical protein K2J30_05485 [Clostridia bacterium]|nr:hypothetical protein [Clostridia bacterium]